MAQGATTAGIVKGARIVRCLAAASLLALATMLAPTRTAAQVAGRPAITITGTYTVLGVSGGHTIYKNADGQLFYLDPRSGTVRTVASGHKYRKIKHGVEQVTILDIDQKGNVLQKNAKGVAFYLNRRTGDRVFVKWPK